MAAPGRIGGVVDDLWCGLVFNAGSERGQLRASGSCTHRYEAGKLALKWPVGPLAD